LEILTKKYWNAVLSKLIETFISVKFWVIILASFFAYKLINLFIEIKDVILQFAINPHLDINNNEMLNILTTWSKSLLDITLAMFASVIVVILLSREVFKHAKISKNYEFGCEKDDITSKEIKDEMV
jgi:hypothetical protein